MLQNPRVPTVSVRPCTAEDLTHLAAFGATPRDLAHHRERLGWQDEGRAVHLLAWRDERPAGRVTLTSESKYPGVREAHPGLREVNALEAEVPGQGVGTALIRAAEETARRAGAPAIGLAVGADNPGARALYERLGYVGWGGGEVIDEWDENDGSGRPGAHHADACDYLVKPLPA